MSGVGPSHAAQLLDRNYSGRAQAFRFSQGFYGESPEGLRPLGYELQVYSTVWRLAGRRNCFEIANAVRA